jgi:hypothetical protein
MQELFNLRHASARNAIERIFGVLKRRFRILLLAPEYDLGIQARIPAALCAIHNFIQVHDPDEGPLSDTGDLPAHEPDDYHPDPTPAAELEAATDAHAKRDSIAQAMWEDYQDILARRGITEEEPSDDESDGWDDLL